MQSSKSSLNAAITITFLDGAWHRMALWLHRCAVIFWPNCLINPSNHLLIESIDRQTKEMTMIYHHVWINQKKVFKTIFYLGSFDLITQTITISIVFMCELRIASVRVMFIQLYWTFFAPFSRFCGCWYKCAATALLARREGDQKRKNRECM